MQLDQNGLGHQIKVTHSSKYYSIDRAVLGQLKSYHFNAAELPKGKTWRVFFSWSMDGRETRLSNQCVDLR